MSSSAKGRRGDQLCRFAVAIGIALALASCGQTDPGYHADTPASTCTAVPR